MPDGFLAKTSSYNAALNDPTRTPTVAKAPRSAKDVIDAALQDNSSWEWLCYIAVILLIATGLAGFVTGIILGRDLVAIGGAGVTALVWPALRFAGRLRDANIRIRMYELPLSRADTADDAARILNEALGHPSSSAGTNTGGKPK